MQDINEIGDSVRSARKKADLTQAQLAEQLNVSRTEITQIENGHVTRYGRLLQAIADKLGIENLIGKSA